MEFVKWVNENVPNHKKIPRGDRSSQTIKLREQDNNVDMCINVTEVPESAAVIRPCKTGQWRVLQEGNNKNWDALCDYLIVWESSGKLFAVFIELKSTSPHAKGKFQLVWSTPMLHYLWLVFNVDNCLVSPDAPTLVSKYVEIGDKKSPRIPKSTVRPKQSLFFRIAPCKGAQVRYSTKKCFSFHDLLTD